MRGLVILSSRVSHKFFRTMNCIKIRKIPLHGRSLGAWGRCCFLEPRIGEAYQASILGGILGAEEEKEIADEIEMNEGFKESLACRISMNFRDQG